MTEICVIANRNARAVEDAGELLDELAARPGVTIVRPDSRDETIETARRAASGGARLVVAAGGDGTVSAVAHGLLEGGAGPTLAIVPLGTGNDFSRTLALPLDPAEAAKLIDAPAVRRIDAILLETPEEKRWFVNVTTAGDTARVAGQLTDEVKRRWGPLAFLRGALPELLDPTVYEVTIEHEEGSTTHRLVAAAFANARTAAGGIALAPRANLEDGALDVIVVRDGSAVDFAALAARYALADALTSDLVVFQRASRAVVRSDPPLPMSVDGEEVTPAREAVFTVRPGALRIVVGPDYEIEPEK